jgi:hypothetical protein
MKLTIILIILVLLGIGAWYWFWFKSNPEPVEVPNFKTSEPTPYRPSPQDIETKRINEEYCQTHPKECKG